MIGFTVAVGLAALLCLAIEATRLLGVALAALLLVLLVYLYPVWFAALFILGGVALCFILYFKNFRRSNSNAIPELPDRRD